MAWMHTKLVVRTIEAINRKIYKCYNTKFLKQIIYKTYKYFMY